MGYTREDIIHMVEEEDVEFIRLQFTDIYGSLKNMAVTSNQLEQVLDNRCSFPSMAIDGFHDKASASLYLHPDLDTFAIFPWRPQQGRVARLLCDVCKEDGTPFEGDSRQVLKRVMERASEMGYEFAIGPECEFFLFDYDEDGNPTTETRERGGFFDVAPTDAGENARRDIIMTMEDMGIMAASSFHSAGCGQHEINFLADNPLATADNLTTLKLAVRTVAKRHGVYATFMPKPNNNEKGSGLHLKIALYDKNTNRNCFGGEEDGLAQEGAWFIGGLLKHMRSLCFVANPIVNSYKRFIPGFTAPTHIGWARYTYNYLINVNTQDNKANLIELRSPDGASNPYLMLAAVLAAGLDGISSQTDPGPSDLPEEEMELLPANLGEAVDAFCADPFMEETLGRYISHKLVRVKRNEWQEYCSHVMDWEVKQYLHLI